MCAMYELAVGPYACMDSLGVEAWCRTHGGVYLTQQQAARTPAALAFIRGSGANGHIGAFVGDGRTMFETPSSEGHKAGLSPIGRNHWQVYMTWPGIDHMGAGGGDPIGGDDTMPKGVLMKVNGDDKVWCLGVNERSHVLSPEAIGGMFAAGQLVDTKVRVVKQTFLNSIPVRAA